MESAAMTANLFFINLEVTNFYGLLATDIRLNPVLGGGGSYVWHRLLIMPKICEG